jgi:hypothetical protein
MRRALSAAFFVAALTVPMVATPAAALEPTVFGLSIGSPRIEGHATPNATFDVTLKDSTGESKGSISVTVDGDGLFEGCCFYDDVAIGDVVSANGRSLTVPRLTISANRVTDVVSGKGPKGKKLSVAITAWWTLFGPDGQGTITASETTTNATTGAYSKSFVNAELRPMGGDSAWVEYVTPSGDWINRATWFPFVSVHLGPGLRGRFAGFGPEGSLVTVKLWKGQTLRGSGRAVPDEFERFHGRFRASSGDPVYPLLNNTVKADFATDAVMPIKPISIDADVDLQRVSGFCFADARTMLVVYGDPGIAYSGVSESDGSYAFDLEASTIDHGSYVEVTCETHAGDSLVRGLIVP